MERNLRVHPKIQAVMGLELAPAGLHTCGPVRYKCGAETLTLIIYFLIYFSMFSDVLLWV